MTTSSLESRAIPLEIFISPIDSGRVQSSNSRLIDQMFYILIRRYVYNRVPQKDVCQCTVNSFNFSRYPRSLSYSNR